MAADGVGSILLGIVTRGSTTSELLSFLCGGCAACTHQRPIIERLSQTIADLPITRVNVMTDPDTAIAHNVLAHPVLILTRNSVDGVRIVGARSLRYVTNRIVSNLGLTAVEATALLRDVLDSDGELLDRKAKRTIRNAADRVSALQQIPLFVGITKRQLRTVNKLVDEVRYQAETVIFEQGSEGRSMVLIVEGSAIVKRNNRFVTRLGARDVVGEMSIIDGEPRSATVRAETDVTALVLERSDFEHLVDVVPGLAHSVMVTLSKRLRDTDRKLYG